MCIIVETYSDIFLIVSYKSNTKLMMLQEGDEVLLRETNFMVQEKKILLFRLDSQNNGRWGAKLLREYDILSSA